MAGRDAEPSFASGARVLSVGIASTGIFTFAYLAVASHVLSARDYGLVSLCWAIMFVILSVIYRPIEQLLSRTIADRRARGLSGHPLTIPAAIQVGFAAVFLIVVLALRHVVQHDLFGGSAALYWVLVAGVLAYAASYFARGWLAGHQRFALYGALVFLESTSRFLFALAVAVGIAHGVGAVALGMAVAPFASLAVMPFAWRHVRTERDPDPRPVDIAPDQVGDRQVGDCAPRASHSNLEPQASHSDLGAELSMRRGAGFAGAVVAIMLSEQALMNAGVLVVAVDLGARDLSAGLTGFVFNVMLIVRAPLQLFQSIQTSILPHLAGLQARADAAQFRRAIRTTVLVIGGFGLAVALGLLAIGPPVMTLLLGDKGFHYDRWGLAAVGLGMGLHLMAGTFNQAALARGQATRAAACWLLCGALFVAFQIAGVIGSRVTRVEVGYAGATALLCLLLAAVYARREPAAQTTAPAAPASAA
jgi:O-antigen/teichoic acid export membrane protein